MATGQASVDQSEQPEGAPPALAGPARALAEHLAALLGPTTRAILHYGSRAQGRVTRPDSAFDFFIIVDSYRAAYRALALADHTGSRRLAMALAWVLPPNAMAARVRVHDEEREVKCLIFSLRHFDRECSARARDHFVGARMSQSVVLAWRRDSTSADPVLRCVAASRERSYDWARSALPIRLDVAQYCRTILAVSLANEIRPESSGYAETLFAAQRATLLGIYGPVLDRLVTRGVLARDGKGFAQVRPPGPVARLRVHMFFRASKVRTALRLLKQPFLYDGWLDYVLRKIDRSTGTRIELTERERRWPLIFLWPRAYRYLRTRPQHHS